MATAHPRGRHVTQTAGRTYRNGAKHNVNKITLIGRLGQNAEANTAQNNRKYVILSIPTQESWKNKDGEYETRTEWHRIFAWKNLAKFAGTLQTGQLIALEGTLKYR